MKNRILWLVLLAVIAWSIPGHTQSNPIPAIPLPDPPDLPFPFPDDPPDPFLDPFDPINDIPLPEIPDLPPFDDPFIDDFSIPDPPDLDDPFPDLPSLEDLDPAVTGNSPLVFTPEPLPLPFFPSFAALTNSTRRPCSPAKDTRVFLPDRRGQVDVIGICPPRNIKTIPLHFSPNVVRADPAATVLIVTSLDTAEAAIIDAETYAVTYVSLSTTNGDIIASSAAFSPDGSTVYLTNHSDSKPTVGIFDMASRKLTSFITGLGPFPARAAVTPDGTMLWVSCRGDSTVHVFDTRTNTQIATLNVIEPLGITFNPTGTRAYVAAANDFSQGTIDVFETEKMTKVGFIFTGLLPQTILISSTGKFGFVNNRNSKFITQFDPVRLTFVRNINTKYPIQAMGFVRR